MERLEFLENQREKCKHTLEYCEERSKSVKEELSVINEMIDEIEGRMDNTDSAQ